MAKNRTIFEDVGAGKSAVPQPQGGMIDGQKRGRNPVRRWLAVLFLMVVPREKGAI